VRFKNWKTPVNGAVQPGDEAGRLGEIVLEADGPVVYYPFLN
jgi:hypothetical protein